MKEVIYLELIEYLDQEISDLEENMVDEEEDSWKEYAIKRIHEYEEAKEYLINTWQEEIL